jgi:hypothetical protein
MLLGQIYTSIKTKAVAYTKLARWYGLVEKVGFKFFNTIAKSIREHYTEILNYSGNRNTNASAESFNAKIKAFCSSFRGVIQSTYYGWYCEGPFKRTLNNQKLTISIKEVF